MDVFLSFVSRVFSICHEWKVVISSRCFGLVNIDIFIGGDRDLINRRLGDREKICLCFAFFSFFWFGKDPQIAVLWVWPAKFIWFYQGPLTSCSRSRLQPPAHSKSYRALIHTFLCWHHANFSHALLHVWHADSLTVWSTIGGKKQPIRMSQLIIYYISMYWIFRFLFCYNHIKTPSLVH